MVSVGLSATPERRKVDQLQPRRTCRTPRSSPRRRATRRRRRSRPGTTPTRRSPSLQGSTARAARAEDVPEREVAARSRTRTRRSSRSRPAARTASWSRTTCSRSSTSRTATSSRKSPFPKPLHVAVRLVRRPEGQRAARSYLNKFLCKMQKSGQMATIYKATDRRAAAADAGLQVTDRQAWPAARRRPRALLDLDLACATSTRTTSSSSAAARPGSPPAAEAAAAGLVGRPRRRAADARRADLQAARAGLPRHATRRALGRDYLRGRALIEAAERSRRDAAARARARSRSTATRSCSSRTASARATVEARARSCSRPARTTGRSSSRAGRFPA